MATPDARTGFRLPWTSDQRPPDEDEASAPDGDLTAAAEAAPDPAAPDSAAAPVPAADVAPSETAPPRSPAPAAPRSTRKPTKFLADLTRAMQAAAEGAREETLTRFQADAKSFIEQIHSRSAEESAELRRRADDDVIAIRDWSKAEIARIREETEARITDRKSRLEREVEDHAALVEHDIERVHAHVSSFETEMTRFFERLLAEDDPSRFASMAENLPEPPSFDSVAPAVSRATAEAPDADAPVVKTPAAAAPAAETPAAETDPWAGATWSTETADDGGPAEAQVETAEPEAETAETQTADETASGQAEDAPTGEAVEDGIAAFEAASTLDETLAANDQTADADESTYEDPRLGALGLTPDFAAAAEAEAFADADGAAEVEDFPELGEEAIAARLAGLVEVSPTAATDEQSTRVVVHGLVSVASIAGFKRHLGRLPGVASVGVSSGPEGEFVFAVTHAPEVQLSEVIPTLPGFQARVTGSADSELNVTAHDPESDA